MKPGFIPGKSTRIQAERLYHPHKRVLRISEFMARSQSGSDPGEYIELYNPTTRILELAGCGIDKTNTSEVATIDGGVTIAPGAYAVFARNAGTDLGEPDGPPLLLRFIHTPRCTRHRCTESIDRREDQKRLRRGAR